MSFHSSSYLTSPAPDHNHLIIASLIVFVLTLFASMIPIYLIQWHDRKQAKLNPQESSPFWSITQLPPKYYLLQFVTQLGGGVLFHTVFVDLLPDIHEKYELIKRLNVGEMSWKVEEIVCAGFLAIFVIEQMIHTFTGKSHERDGEANATSITTSGRFLHALVLLVAFSCDALFDGFSIGAQQAQDNDKQLFTLLIAILSHKLLIAPVLSIQIYEKCMICSESTEPRMPIKRANCLMWLLSTLFAALTPLGIVTVALVISRDSTIEQELWLCRLSAFSTGTIIYIIFIEIICANQNKSTTEFISGYAQWAALVTGFVSMHTVSKVINLIDT